MFSKLQHQHGQSSNLVKIGLSSFNSFFMKLHLCSNNNSTLSLNFDQPYIVHLYQSQTQTGQSLCLWFIYSHHSFSIGAFIYNEDCDHIKGNLWRPHHFLNLLIWEKSNTLLHPKTILGFHTRGNFFFLKSPSFSSYHQ